MAHLEGDKKKVAKLQMILVNSAGARALAIYSVVINGGSPGIDKVVIDDVKKFAKAMTIMKSVTSNTAAYNPQPTKRVMIPKANGGERPLGIPTQIDRCVQKLYSFALVPLAEVTADKNSFGFRTKRGTLDAIFTLYLGLTTGTTWPHWIYDADIAKFFDTISHDWILENIPLKTTILRKFLKAGFVFDHKFSPSTDVGVPQGSPISPIISNMVLDGLEKVISEVIKGLKFKNIRDSVTFVRYADDFIIVGLTEPFKWFFTKAIIPKIVEFLKIRGVALSAAKSKLVTRVQGVSFLGYKISWDENKMKPGKYFMNIRPDDGKWEKVRLMVTAVFAKHNTSPVHMLATSLNSTLKSWANYYKYGYVTEMFKLVDRYVWDQWLSWAKRKYPKLTLNEIFKKHFLHDGKGLQPCYTNSAGKVIFIVRLDKGLGPVYGPIRGGKFNGVVTNALQSTKRAYLQVKPASITKTAYLGNLKLNKSKSSK